MNTLLKTDVYKIEHAHMYPKGTEYIQSNLTPRSFKYFEKYRFYESNSIKVSSNLLKYVVKKLEEEWEQNFWSIQWREIKFELQQFQEKTGINILSMEKEYKELHDWCSENTKLPIDIWVLGDCFVKEKTPIMTIRNIDKRFYWLVNYIETWLLSETWPLITADNIMWEMKNFFYQELETVELMTLAPEYMCHDFSQRGYSSTESAIKVGIAYLNNFSGSDNMPAIHEWIKYEDILGKKNFGYVIASEHSTMMVNGKRGELEVYKRLINQYQNGILSLVSDTFNYWNVLDSYLPKLKKDILTRNGKLVVRGDSGNITDIILGDKTKEFDSSEYKGTLELLAETFGSYDKKINSGCWIDADTDKIAFHYNTLKFLNPKVGVIFGEGINTESIKKLFKDMKDSGWARTNVVLGIGAFMLAMNSRDTLGFAFKTSAVCVNGEWKMVRKEPITDIDSLKKSHLGFINVYKNYEYTKTPINSNTPRFVDKIRTPDEWEKHKEERGTLWLKLTE